jgi:hypothetical protein
MGDRRNFFVAVLVAVCLGSLFPAHIARSADLSPDLQRYVGTWQARFKGTIFVVLKLREQNSELGGTVLHSTLVQSDPKGNLLAVDLTKVEDKIVEAHTEDGTLIFDVDEKANEGSPVRCELKITGKNAAELRMIVPAPGPQFKPWKINRTSQNPY